MNKEILTFMAAYFAEKEAWLSPDIEIPKETHGYEFKHKEGLKGLVVFGKSYPLSDMDLPIAEHLKVRDAIKNTKPFGFVHDLHGQKQKMYKKTNGETLLL